ncbi:phytoene desaturase family protein [Streptomyces noursei]|uniref:Dehydrogenase n=1 Tax=Streptomyces noursei TaxID=1971 RepID=A0A2N8P8H6_STRNR|nr:NAD(P)/FAD-dependent oxidoreductase [Streptomyces noursei]PNE37324.1 dehydrogenase [Streptomyces noursei]
MTPDAVIVGTGPNGLAAGVTLARAGLKVELYEAHGTIGGGLRTKPLFDSDVHHDICAAVHPMAAASPFFTEFDLTTRNVDLLRAEAGYAHPLPGGRSAVAYHDVERTCAELGPDGARWRSLMRPLLGHSGELVDLILSGPRALPGAAATALRLAPRLLAHGTPLAPRQFTDEPARALLAGVAAHAVGRLPTLAGATVALLLGHLAHTTGWPLPRGGSARIADALAADITAHGGVFHTGRHIVDLRELPPARAVLIDVAPKGLLQIAGDRLPARYRARLARFRYGPAAAKVDFLVSGPVPWAAPETARAPTVHLGGTQAGIFRQETLTARGIATGEPFVLLVDPAVADPGRAHHGKRPIWTYAHMPHGSTTDPYDLIRGQIERYAPGFTDTVLAHRSITGAAYEEYNPNYVGGDLGAGAMTLKQSLARPVPQTDPYRTPLRGLYLCSAATPPGPGVHGMCGYLAARSALRREFGIHEAPALAHRL